MTTDGKEPCASLLAKIRAIEALVEQAENRVRATVPPRAAAALIADGSTPQVSTGALRYALTGPPPHLPEASSTCAHTFKEDW